MRSGDTGATDALLPFVYDELRGLARHYFASERVEHTLQPTALVHEVYMRIADQTASTWKDKAHFLGIAARVMRQILVDHSRRKNAKKRSGKRESLTLDAQPDSEDGINVDIEAIDGCLTKLAALDKRKARVVELRIFAGMTMEEIAEAMTVSKRTVEGDWHFASAWLRGELDRIA